MNPSLLQIDVPPTYIGAPITVVGEKPGADEVAAREGFVGAAGRSLAQMARAAGINSYNKSNVVKAAAGGFTSDDFKRNFYESVSIAKFTKSGSERGKTTRSVRPTAEYVTWQERLRSELSEPTNRSNVVVAAGAEALFTLCGEHSIEAYRGSCLESMLIPGQKVIPILHPASIFHSKRWEYYYVTITDLKRAKRESESALVREPAYSAILRPKWADVLDFVGVAMQPGIRWCVDLETRGGWIACVGLSCGTNRSDIRTIAIPIQTTTGPYWKSNEEADLWKLLALLFRRNPEMVGQNVFSFDLDLLLDYGVEPSGVALDTMSGFAFLYPELPKALDFIVSLYGTLPYYKFESKTWNSGIPDEQLWVYNTKDTYSTLEVSWELDRDLKQAGLWELYQNYCIPVHWMALEIQRRKIPVSVENRESARQVVLEELEKVKRQRVQMLKQYEPNLSLSKKRTKFAIEYVKEGKLWTGKSLDVEGIVATGEKKAEVTKAVKNAVKEASGTVEESITAETFNVESNKHMQTLIFNAMKLPARHKKGSDALTTNEEALMDLIAWYPDRTDDLKLLLQERHLNKALDYVEYKLDPEGCLAFQVNFPGTKSFRFSMSTSPRGFGFNAQTPPRWSRYQYIPPPGRVFIGRDLSQVEARVVAALANCRLQLERFADPNWSIHKDLGKVIYGEVPTKDTPRYVASKGGVHGGNFREGPLKLSRATGAPLRDTRLAVEGYRRTYPEIPTWHDSTRRTVITDGQVVNPFGFRRIFYRACGHLALKGIMDESEWNEACNAIPQSVPPFLINSAVCKTMVALPWVWFHHQGHDSYLASVPIGKALEADAFIREALDIPMQFDSGELRVPSEAQVGYTWLEMMPLKDREPTFEEWDEWRKAEEAAGRGRSRAAILQGINGIL